MSRIERKYILISTSYLAELCDCVLVTFYPYGGHFDAYHEEFESDSCSILDISDRNC